MRGVRFWLFRAPLSITPPPILSIYRARLSLDLQPAPPHLQGSGVDIAAGATRWSSTSSAAKAPTARGDGRAGRASAACFDLKRGFKDPSGVRHPNGRSDTKLSSRSKPLHPYPCGARPRAMCVNARLAGRPSRCSSSTTTLTGHSMSKPSGSGRRPGSPRSATRGWRAFLAARRPRCPACIASGDLAISRLWRLRLRSSNLRLCAA